MRIPFVFLGSVLGLMACNPRIDASACGPGSILATDLSGQLVCTARPQTGLTLPSACEVGLVSDGKQLLCADRLAVSPDAANASAALTALDEQIAALQASFDQSEVPPQGSYIGPSVNGTNGRIMANATSGVAAAALICSNDYNTKSHMCTMDELYQSVASGILTGTSTIAPSWVYMPNANQPFANPVEPLAGIADTCGDYTDQSGSNFESSILAEWGPLADGTPGLRWHGGADARCYAVHRIACCK